MIFGRSEPARAVYARILDGRHLWLAVRGAEELWLGERRLECAPDDGFGDPGGPVLASVTDLEHVLAGADAAALTSDARGRRPVLPPEPTDDGPMVDPGPFALVVDGGHLLIRRGPADDRAHVSGLVTGEDGPIVCLATPAATVEAMHGDRVVATVATDTEGRFEVSDLEVPPGRGLWFRVDGRPLVRDRGLLRRPNAAVMLPPAHDGVVLRWRPNGRLFLERVGDSE